MYDYDLSREGGGQSRERGYKMCSKEPGGDGSHMALEANTHKFCLYLKSTDS